MISFSQFEKNLESVRYRMDSACVAAGRKAAAVSLLPVTKNHPVDAVRFAQRGGLSAVGENRVQEASEKRNAYDGVVRCELIGHLQSNKAQQAVEVFDRIQSVDSLKIMRRLDRFAADVGKLLPILIQCNTGEDPNKYGFAVGEVEAAVEVALGMKHLQLDGLMTIAPLDDDPDVARAAFAGLRELRDGLSQQFGVPLDELSMGMTGDLEIAIAAGSTQIRVGTALYGPREL
jgi:PLP dependent protein